MRSMSVVIVAAVAGSVVSLAQAQSQPRTGPSVAEMVNKREPLRVAKARFVNGVAVRVGEWLPYAANPGDAPDTPYVDFYEGDALGNPINFCNSGCSQQGSCPGAGDSGRYRFNGFVNSYIVNDMTVAPGTEGLQATRAQFAWNWGPLSATQCYVVLGTAEDFQDCTAGVPGYANDYDAVVYDFGPIFNGGGYDAADIDLSVSAPGLFHQMPTDGSGAYIGLLANFEDPVTGEFTMETTIETQFMNWGAGADENPPDGRVGTQGELAWLDLVLVDGMHTLDECFTLLYTVDLCPNPLAPMVAFWGEASGPVGCYANCDGSTGTPVLNVADFGCFLTKFASGDPYANCDGSTGTPILNVADFGCFLTKFAAGCN